MKQLLTIVFLFITGIVCAQQPETTKPAQTEKSNPSPEILVDEEAQFPGGMKALREYVSANIVYPKHALDKGVKGNCFLRFEVSAKGEISNITVSKHIPNCPECDAEAVRVVSLMPTWIPAKKNGKVVASYSRMVIKFSFTE
jgi:periplasmic protein TonB